MESQPKLIDTQTLHKNRPLSPHLSIYRLQLTSGLSILHRITGAYLYLGLVILAWGIFTLVYFPYALEEIGNYIQSCMIISIIVKFMLLSWTFSLFYHQLNGIRHLFWDAGKGFDLKTTYLTGKIVVILAILLTIACWAMVYIYQPSTIILENIVIDIQQ